MKFLQGPCESRGKLFDRDEEFEEELLVLGTLPGWLSFYDLRRCIGMPHGAALREAEEQAVAIASRGTREPP